MPALQFGSGAYTRSGAPAVTAAPFTWAISGYYDSLTGAQNTIGHLCRATTADHFSLRFDSADAGAFRIVTQVSGSGSSGIGTNTVSAATPFVAIVRVTSATLREAILNGDLANKGTDTVSKTPPGINRISFGRRDDSSGGNDFEGAVFWSALWNVALDDAEIVAIAAGAPPPLIRPSALMNWWWNFGRNDGTTVIDVFGRSALTISTASMVDTGEKRYWPSDQMIGRRTTRGLILPPPSRLQQHLLIR